MILERNAFLRLGREGELTKEEGKYRKAQKKSARIKNERQSIHSTQLSGGAGARS